jgi:hypothetical protein
MTDQFLREMFPGTDPKVFEEKAEAQPDAQTREAFPTMYTPAQPPAPPDSDRAAFPASPGMFGESPALAPAPPPSAWDEQVAAWGREAQSDPEIGGVNWDANLAAARSVIAKYGDADLKEMLNRTGVGNRRELVRLLAKIARGEGR